MSATTTEAEITRAQAEAGAHAAANAAAAGGSREDITSLMQSAAVRNVPTIQGRPLHGMTLQVTLCIELLKRAFSDPFSAMAEALEKGTDSHDGLLALCRIAYAMIEPREAYECLRDILEADSEPDRTLCTRSYDALCLEVAGDWTPRDIAEFAKHLSRLGKPTAAAPPRP